MQSCAGRTAPSIALRPRHALIVPALESITDANGNQIRLTRNSARPVQITQITDAVGRSLTLTYDGANRVTVITDPIGQKGSVHL